MGRSLSHVHFQVGALSGGSHLDHFSPVFESPLTEALLCPSLMTHECKTEQAAALLIIWETVKGLPCSRQADTLERRPCPKAFSALATMNPSLFLAGVCCLSAAPSPTSLFFLSSPSDLPICFLFVIKRISSSLCVILWSCALTVFLPPRGSPRILLNKRSSTLEENHNTSLSIATANCGWSLLY